MEGYQLAAAGWGEPVELKVFTDERVAAEDLKAGFCDGLMMTGIRARQFVPFTGSIDAIGGLQDYTSLQTLIELLAHPKLAESQRHGAYETAGILPLGAAYLHINDRTINSVEKSRATPWRCLIMTGRRSSWPNMWACAQICPM